MTEKINLDDLISKGEKATKGPWEFYNQHFDECRSYYETGDDSCNGTAHELFTGSVASKGDELADYIVESFNNGDANWLANGEYIAAVDPSTITTLARLLKVCEDEHSHLTDRLAKYESLLTGLLEKEPVVIDGERGAVCPHCHGGTKPFGEQFRIEDFVHQNSCPYFQALQEVEL